MSGIYNEIQEGSYNELLFKRFAMKMGAPAPALVPEISAGISIEDDRPEWGWLKREVLAGTALTVNAVAGQFSMVQLYLPSTAQALAVVTNVRLLNATPVRIARGVGIGAGLGGWAGRATATRDFRWAGDRTQLIVESTNNVAAPSTFGRFAELENIGDEFTAPIVITPNTSLVLSHVVLAADLRVQVEWYERGAQQSELV